MAKDMKTMQKTTFIVTVHLKHICSKTDWDQVSDEEKIWEMTEHWKQCFNLPNLALARGQIERCGTTGRIHINAGLKFKKVWRARTLQNKWPCWAEPAMNEDAVLNYGKKSETRLAELPNFGVRKKKKPGAKNPKQMAIALLVQGFSPEEICLAYPEVFFTHHRAIIETYKMMSLTKVNNRVYSVPESEEE